MNAGETINDLIKKAGGYTLRFNGKAVAGAGAHQRPTRVGGASVKNFQLVAGGDVGGNGGGNGGGVGDDDDNVDYTDGTSCGSGGVRDDPRVCLQFGLMDGRVGTYVSTGVNVCQCVCLHPLCTHFSRS